MKRMLADVCPELINEWSQRNLPITPDSVTHGSNKCQLNNLNYPINSAKHVKTWYNKCKENG